MASTVLSGASNPSYTNTTGQNVRIVINFIVNCTAISWAGVSITNLGIKAAGRNLAFYDTSNQTSSVGNNMVPNTSPSYMPTELMLAPGQTFSATCGVYNIVIIPENG